MNTQIPSKTPHSWPRRAFRLAIALSAVLLVSGCAHGPGPEETQPASPTSDTTGQEEEPSDYRYRLPEANKRALTIFLDSQSFEYVEDDQVLISGPVSAGAKEHPTPAGNFRVLSKQKDKRSGSYTNYFDEPTPMPYALQFRGPYYVHEGYLPGHAASHGCVRLAYEDAALLYSRIRVGDPVNVAKNGGPGGAVELVSGLPLVF